MQQTPLVANQKSLSPRTPTGRQYALAQDAEMHLSSSGGITSCHQTIHHYCRDSLEWWSWTLTFLLLELCLICLLHHSWFTAKHTLWLQNQVWTGNAFNLQCLANSKWFLFLTEPLFWKDDSCFADAKRWFLKDPSCKISIVVQKHILLFYPVFVT